MTTSLTRFRPAVGRRACAGARPSGCRGHGRRRAPPRGSAPDPRLADALPLETEYRPRHPLDLLRTVLYQRRGAGDPTMTIDGRRRSGALSRTPAGHRDARAARDGTRRHPRRGLGTGRRVGARPAARPVRRARRRVADFEAGTASPHRRRAPPQPGHAAAAAPTSSSTRSRARSSSRRSRACRRSAPGGASSRGSASAPPAPRRGRCSRRRPSTAGGASRPGPGIAPGSSRRRRAPSSQPRSAATRSCAPSRPPRTERRARARSSSACAASAPWTSAETRIRAFGDPDAVSVGDYHLAHEVGFALTGSRVDDDGMLRAPRRLAGSPSARHPADRRERTCASRAAVRGCIPRITAAR